METNNSMIATIETPHRLIIDSLGLIKFNKDRLVFSVIKNCSPYAIYIERNDLMGFAEIHNKEAKL
jgi:hypothetical protein